MGLSFRIIKYYVLLILIFFYLYPTPFTFSPVGLSTRMFLALVGFLFFSITYFKAFYQSEKFIINKKKIILLTLLVLVALVSTISITINQTTDTEYIKYVFSMLLIYFAYITLKIFLSNFKEKIDIIFISNLIINAVLLQLFIALLMYLIPAFGQFITSIQIIDNSDLNKLSKILEFRLVGLGTKFFGAGIINAFALLLVSYNIRERKLGFISLLKYTLIFITIFSVGMMMSRTTLIGAFLGIIYIFAPKIKGKGFRFNHSFSFLFFLFFIPTTVFLVFILLFPEISKQFQSLFKFGFELFINYNETGKITSESTEDLKTMYILPNEIKTYLIGDGKFSGDETSSTYYMGTDVGFIRLIYYFGIPGLISYLLFQFYIIKISFKDNNLFVFLIFIFLLLLNLKGVSDIFFLILLFNLTSKSTQQKLDNKENPKLLVEL